MSYNKQILQLEVGHYGITKDGTTLIEISIHNYKEIIKKEEDEYSLASLFSKQTYLLDALLLSIYSRVYSKRTVRQESFFTPLEFLCSDRDFQQIQEFVENAGYEDSFKFVFGDEEKLGEKEILYKLTNEEDLLQKGFLCLYNNTSDNFEEDFFSAKALTFSTPIHEKEKCPECGGQEEIVELEDTRKVTIPYIVLY